MEQKNKYKFSGEDLSELKEKLSNAKDGLRAALNRLYETIFLPIPDREGQSPITLKTIDLQAQLKSEQLFELVTILQNLSDKSSQMGIKLTVTAYAKDQFDLTWIKGAIEEPLDEADIMASTKLS